MNISADGWGWGQISIPVQLSIMHLICESETGFAKLLKPASDTVSLTNLKTVHLFTLTAVDAILIKQYDAFILQVATSTLHFMWINTYIHKRICNVQQSCTARIRANEEIKVK